MKKFVQIIQQGGMAALFVNIDELLDVDFKNTSNGPVYILTYKNGQTRTILATDPSVMQPLLDAIITIDYKETKK